jgi:hypothetical protein
MAAGTLTNPLIRVNGVDLSSDVTAVHHQANCDEIPTHVIGDAWVSRRKSRVQTVISLEFLQNCAAARVHQTLAPLLDSDVPVEVDLRPVNDLYTAEDLYTDENLYTASESSTNPTLPTPMLLVDYSFLKGGVGEVAPASARFVSSEWLGGSADVGGGMFGDDVFGDGIFGGS